MLYDEPTPDDYHEGRDMETNTQSTFLISDTILTIKYLFDLGFHIDKRYREYMEENIVQLMLLDDSCMTDHGLAYLKNACHELAKPFTF